ncbi:MAG: isoprenylcysteine carboxylmethyltransferase family protein [Roseobacter sp.]
MSAPPPSAVSVGSGVAGSVALVIVLVIGVASGWSAVTLTFALMFATAAGSALWDVIVDKVHLRPSTGMDWGNPHPWSEIYAIIAVKLVGLAVTFGLIAFGYQMLATYQLQSFDFYFWTLSVFGVAFLAMCPVYIALTTRYMTAPRDKLWQFGRMMTGGRHDVDMEQVRDHLLGWGIKMFFLAFLFSIILPTFGPLANFSATQAFSGIVPFFVTLVAVMFLFDVCFGTFGYVMTFRPLDSHIRSSNPYLSAWVFALVCYPPFQIMAGAGPLNYGISGQSWSVWLADMPVMLIVWGIVMTVLTGLYASATVIFGIRFSNLTNRGIITVGPYRYFKHPAYLSKNIYWWFAAMPFLTTAEDPTMAVRNCILLGLVNVVYYMRAKTEEKHLMHDPAYQAYAAWIAEHGLIPKLKRRLLGRARVLFVQEKSV